MAVVEEDVGLVVGVIGGEIGCIGEEGDIATVGGNIWFKATAVGFLTLGIEANSFCEVGLAVMNENVYAVVGVVLNQVVNIG